MIALLKNLAALPNTDLVLISGRDRQTLSHWFGQLPIRLVAEHGFFLKSPGSPEWEELAPGVDRSWMPVVEEAMASYVARTPGSFIERKYSGLAWHFRKAEPGFGLRQGRELAHHLTEYFANRPLGILQGACAIEAVSQGVDKGSAYRNLLGRSEEPDFILVAGDDSTDEKPVPHRVPYRMVDQVGSEPTAARHRVEGPDWLRALLIAALDGRRP